MDDQHRWNTYIEYAAFREAEKTLGLPFGSSGHGIIGRFTSQTQIDHRDMRLFIKPGVSRDDALAMLDMIREAVKENGGWEHSEPPSNVVELRPHARGRRTRDDLDDEIPF